MAVEGLHPTGRSTLGVPVNWRLNLVLVFAFGLLLLIAAVSAYSIHTLVGAARWLDHANQVRIEIEELGVAYFRMRVPWRNFVVHGETEQLDEYRREARSIPPLLSVLKALTQSDSAQHSRSVALERFLQRDVAALNASVERRLAGRVPDPQAEISHVTLNELRRYEIAQLLADMRRHEEGVANAQRSRWQRDADLAYAVIGAGNAVALAILAMVFVALRRENDARRAAQRTAENFAAETEDLYNHAPCGYHSLDADGRFIRINQTELEWLGYTREEVIGRLRFTDLLAPEARAGFERRYAQLHTQSEVRDIECNLIARNGKSLPVSISATAVLDEQGNLVACRSTAFDITERRRAEEALRRSAEDLRAVQRSVYAISAAADAEAAVSMMVEKVCEFSGWPYGQAWIPVPGDARLVCGPSWFHPQPALERFRQLNRILSFERGEGSLGRVWQSCEPAYEWELAPGAEGSRRGLAVKAGFRSWIGYPLAAGREIVALVEFFGTEPSPRGERVLSFVSVLAGQIAPVLERMRAHGRAAALNRELEQRSNQLEAANKELEGFSYSVSHDLRVPLRAMDGFSRMLEEDYMDRLDDEGRRLLGVVRDNARKMGQLIEDLLAFSRLGRKPIAPREIDMAAQAREVFGEVVDGSRTRLEIGELPRAFGDPALMRQVWLNLLANAVKFSSRGEDPQVTVSGRIDADQAVYCVRDNGAGFDMRYADKLFGVFQRLHSPEEFAGTGVGLAIVQRVVARHGGRVWAEGEVGKGASFYFTLPRTSS